MEAATIDVAGIGNAIVDVIAHADEAFLAAQGFRQRRDDADRRGARRGALRARWGRRSKARAARPATRWPASPRSAATAPISARCATTCWARSSATTSPRSASASTTPPATSGPGTARCLILVTPDGQRTMGTYLGACVDLGPGGHRPGDLIAARAGHLSRRLSVRPAAGAGGVPQGGRRSLMPPGGKVALSLSDPFCVGRHRDDFRDLVAGEVDILFANEAEICSLYETEDFATAAAAVRGHVEIAALTRSEEGSVIIAGRCRVSGRRRAGRAGRRYHRRRRSLCRGFLFGLTRGLPLPTCGTIGSLCAAEIISHVGARPGDRASTDSSPPPARCS